MTEKIPRCSERETCINFNNPANQFYAGVYCPAGVDSQSDVVYLATGVTQQDAQYLASYNARSGVDGISCEHGDFMLRRPDPSTDFADPDVNNSRVELHGESLACVRPEGGGDFISAIFDNGKQQVSFVNNKTFVGENSADLYVELHNPDCAEPNLTALSPDGDPGAVPGFGFLGTFCSFLLVKCAAFGVGSSQSSSSQSANAPEILTATGRANSCNRRG